MSERVLEMQKRLKAVGFPLKADGNMGPETRQAIVDFKDGFAFHTPPLRRSSPQPGRGFRRALKKSVDKGGRCSPNFFYREFASKGNGWIKVDYKLVRGLERYRRLIGHGVAIRSGYRDPQHNKDVGGVPNSQHLYGNAVDLGNPEVSVNKMRALGSFSGIGFVGATGLVLHVDVRHRGPNNTTGGTTKNPTLWRYG